MLNRLLLLSSFIFLLSNCSGVGVQDEFEDDFEEFVIEDQPQDQQDFEVVQDEESAVEINEQVQQEIEEVEVADRVFFALDKSDLDNDARSVLNLQAEWLKSDDSIKVTIEGHCDERGTREYNIALGERRALSVKNYLVSKGVDPARIETISYGKERPEFVGSGEEIWAKNRRGVTVVR